MKIINLLDKKKIQHAANLLLNSKEAIALTGAGISTESGIPDFRSEGGLWENTNQKFMETYNHFLKIQLNFGKWLKILPQIYSEQNQI